MNIISNLISQPNYKLLKFVYPNFENEIRYNPKIMKNLIIISILMLITAFSTFSQTCVNCDTNSIASGNFAAAIGQNNTASGNASFAVGANSIASGPSSIALGLWNISDDSYSTTFGSFCNATANKSMVIGHGYGENFYLTNGNSYSLSIGFNSNMPTMFIGTSQGPGFTGKIGIGNITSPQTKLHLLADEGEEAAIFIQPNNWDNNENSTMYLGSLNTYITANKESGINFHSEGNYMFGNDANVLIKATETETSLQIKEGDIYIEDIDFGIIMKSPNGKCWRGQVDDNGQLNFSELENCPETVTSVNDNKQEESGFLKVFPNPANNTLNIELQDDSKGQKQVLLYTANGMIVYTDTFVGSTTQINVSEFNSGIYIVEVGNEGNYVSRKVSIK